MSQIRTAKASDIGAFPGSTFVVDGSPPIAQCQEAQTLDDDCLTDTGQFFVQKVGAWTGLDLTGKKVTITNSGIDDGTYTIISNTDDELITEHPFGNNDPTTTARCHDAGQTYLTRNESSFQRFIEDQGKAHTTKGGQLFTDLADPPMDDACSDTWSPQ